MKKFKCSKLLGRADMAENLDIVFCKNCIKQQSYYHGPDSRLGCLHTIVTPMASMCGLMITVVKAYERTGRKNDRFN